MGVTFALRGTSLTAYRALDSATPVIARASTVTDPAIKTTGLPDGCYGNSVIDLTGGTHRNLLYAGNRNFPNTSAMAFRVRFVPQWTGFPGTIQYFSSATNATSTTHSGFVAYWNTNGKLIIQAYDKYGVARMNWATTATFNATANTIDEFMFSWDGSGSANAGKLSRMGVEVETKTASALTAGRDQRQVQGIGIGMMGGTYPANFWLNEMIFWDTAENHVYTPGEDFYACDAFDGAPTDPGIANVRNNEWYTTPSGLRVKGELKGGLILP